MRKSILSLSSLILIGALFLTGCTGVGVASSWPGLSVKDQTAYLANSTSVEAIKVSDGSSIWRYPEKIDAKVTYYAPPAPTPDGQLIIGDYSGTLTSLDAQTGKQKWTFKPTQGRWIAAPLVTSKMIYAPNADGILYALDLSGNLKWKFETGNPIWSTPVTDGKVLYLTSMDQNVYAIGIDSGNKIWATSLKGAILGSPVLSEDGLSIYAGSLNKEIYSLKTEDGSVTWKISLKDGIWEGPKLEKGSLYVGDLSGNFYSISTKDEKISWTYQSGGSIVSTPAIVGEKVYFTNEAGALISLTLDGKPVSTKSISDKLYASPVPAGELILVPFSGKDQLLIALDQNGNQVWTFAPPK